MQKNEAYMRYAVISDIHANVWALEAVLNDIERHSVDAILQLGDVLYGPLAPQATYACLQAASIPVFFANTHCNIAFLLSTFKFQCLS